MGWVVVGGLGGGGDVGLAAILASMLRGVRVVYASFSGCHPERYRGRRVAGSLVEPGEYHPRDFEWALSRAFPGAEVYRLCVAGGFEGVMEGLRWLDRRYSPKCTIHADIGGDGLLTGYESSLGSYRIDSIARAALAEASERLGWKSLVAVGGLGLEGGRRRELDLGELVAGLLYYEDMGALLGVVEPPSDRAGIAWRLMHPGREMVSVMLPLYAAALRGKTAFRVEKGYSTGLHRIDWWAKYVFILDARRSCEASPLCTTARSDWNKIWGPWSPPKPPRGYLKALRKARQDPEDHLRRIVRRMLDNTLLEKHCA